MAETNTDVSGVALERERKFYRVSEAAKILDRHSNNVYDLIRRGSLEARKIRGGGIRITGAALVRFQQKPPGGRAFESRYQGRELEILNYINDEGGGRVYADKVMKHFGAKDYIAWTNYVDKIAKRVDFKFADRVSTPVAEHQTNPSILLHTKYLRQVTVKELELKLEAEDIRLDEEIAALRKKVILGEIAWKTQEDYHPPDLSLAELNLPIVPPRIIEKNHINWGGSEYLH